MPLHDLPIIVPECLPHASDDLGSDPRSSDVAQGLDHDPGRGPGAGQRPGGRVTELDRAVAHADRAGGPVGQVREPRRDLGRDAELVGRLEARDLDPASGRAGNRGSHERQRRRKRPQLRMTPWLVVDPPGEPTQDSGAGQPRQGLIDGGPASEAKEVRGHEDRARLAGADATEDAVLDRLGHVRNYTMFFGLGHASIASP